MKNFFTILIVDDEPSFLTSMMRIFRRTPHDVITAQDAKNALKILATRKVDVALLDYMMPGMNGLTLQQKISSHFPHVVTMFVTAIINTEVSAKIVSEVGVNRFFSKPVDAPTLLSSIQREFKFRQAINRYRASRPRTF